MYKNIFSSTLYTMVNKAKSQALRKQILRKEVDDLKAYEHCKPRWIKPKMPVMEKAI